MYTGREKIYYRQIAILLCDKSSHHQVGNVILKWLKSGKRGHFHVDNCSLISVISTVSFPSPTIASTQKALLYSYNFFYREAKPIHSQGKALIAVGYSRLHNACLMFLPISSK